MNRPDSRLYAWLLIAAGILLNPWIVAKVFAADGYIDEPSVVLALASVESACIAVAILLLRRSGRATFAMGAFSGVLACLAVVTIYQIYVRLPIRYLHENVDPRQVLQRALEINESSTVALGDTTSSVLSDLHEHRKVVEVFVPPDGVLDTAVGIDPLVLAFGRGEATFEIVVVENGGAWKRVFSKSFAVSESNLHSLRWQEFTVDLTPWSGQRLKVVLLKRFSILDPMTAATFYDLAAEDLLFWRKPQVRPRSIDRRRNVILISIDTLRADHLGFMGYDRETTPNLDRLASEGTYFTNCFSQAPWTGPSHFAILTGTYPSTNGSTAPYQQIPRWWNDSLPTMASILRLSGYRTAAFTGRGSISAEFGFAKGFDSYAETPLVNGSDIDEVVGKASRWIALNRDRTFFLFLHTYEVHSPFAGTHFVNGQDPLDSARDLIDHYDGDIYKTDQSLRKLFDTLRDHSIDKNTLIVITSDHGEELLEGHARGFSFVGHGHSLYDEVLHVPLILIGFDQREPGRDNASQVRSIDILPTLLDQLEIPIPREVQGTSLLPLLQSGDVEDLPVVTEATTYGTERVSLRANNLKYIHRLSYGQLADPCCSGFPLTPEHELYDLRNDPKELMNLATAREDVVDRMRAALDGLRGSPIAEANETPSDEYLERRQLAPSLTKTLRALGYIR